MRFLGEELLGPKARLKELLLYYNSDTSETSYQMCALAQWYTPGITHFYFCGRI